MPDYTVTATRGASTTYGSATSVVQVRAPAAMTAMETSTARFDIEPYTVNRGNFLPGDAHIRMAVSVYGIVSGNRQVAWEGIGERGMSLWDGGSCGQVWMPVVSSEQIPMYAGQSSVIGILPNVPGDSGSTRTFRAAHTRAGARFDAGTGAQATSMWCLVAARPVAARNGPLVSLGLYTQGLSVVYNAGGLVFNLVSASGIPVAIGHHPMDATGKYVPVVAISTDPGVLRIIVRDSGTPTTYTWDIPSNIVADKFVVGGYDSPESIVYAAAMGSGGNLECERYVRLVSGYLS